MTEKTICKLPALIQYSADNLYNSDILLENYTVNVSV